MIARVFIIMLCKGVADASPVPPESSAALQKRNMTHDQKNDTQQQSLQFQAFQASANDDIMEGSITDIAAPADVRAMRLRGSMPSTAMPESRQLSRRRRRRRKNSNNPCSDIETAICKTSEYIFCVAGCLDISSCKDACDKSLYKPCKKSLKSACEKSALDICEEAIKKAGEKSCTEICLEAAATADAAGGGPEDPAGDVIAADIEASCEMSCESAVDSSGLAPGTEAFAKAVCKGIGF
jgi:hypothetical protein